MTGRRSLEDPSHVPPRALVAGTVVFLLVGFLLHGLHRVNQQRQLDPSDTTAYLQEAHFIAEHGGPLRMVGLLLSGTYRYDNRQPLYPWVLSWFAVRDFAFLPRAKLVSLTSGLVCFLLCLWIGRRLADRLTALLLGLLLLFSFTFFRLTSMVACESLLMVFVVGWWYVAGVALERPKVWPLAGFLAGAAFLVKGTGLFLVGITVLAVLLRRRRAFKSGWFWLFFVGFVAAAWPLLVRNARLFHNPVHNFNTATMWLDRWADTYRPEFETYRPGPMDYLRTHTASQIASRFGAGLVGQAQMLFEALHVLHLPALPFGLPPWVSGVLIVFLAGGGMAGDRRRDLAVLTLVSVAVFFLIFTWYHPVVQGARFILPVVPLIFYYAARGVVRLWAGEWALRPLGLGAVAFLALTVLYLAVLPLDNPLTSYQDPPHGYEALREWIRKNVAEDEPFVLGPTHDYHFQAYTPRFPRRQYALPAVASMRELREWLAKRGIRTVVLDLDSYGRNQALFGENVGFDRENGLHLVHPIPGWRLVEHLVEPPVPYLIFRLEEQPARLVKGPRGNGLDVPGRLC